MLQAGKKKHFCLKTNAVSLITSDLKGTYLLLCSRRRNFGETGWMKITSNLWIWQTITFPKPPAMFLLTLPAQSCSPSGLETMLTKQGRQSMFSQFQVCVDLINHFPGRGVFLCVGGRWGKDGHHPPLSPPLLSSLALWVSERLFLSIWQLFPGLWATQILG